MIDKDTYGPWAFIAGGSEGVGAGFAEELAKAGLNLVLMARKPGPLEETAAKARAHGVEVRTLAVDLLAADAVARIGEITADLEVGLLIFNAGANTYGHEFVTGDLDACRKVLTLNVDRQLELSHIFGAPMRERRRGGIVLLGSLAGFVGAEHMSIYAAAKAFSRVFAEGLWLEMAEHGVDVVELILGVTRTPAMERAGLDFDLPGLNASDPYDVAREGLEHLTDGPVWVAGGNYELASSRAGLPRGEIVRAVAAETRAMMGR
ncbi:SDR family NAD(P)-dependent oxidoreductase [Prescottella equi]|uniref:SDR family NAD(P)-dependent oxidoreductase n=1 Tax=Rhodococcus hoagii TaxID=43767 RepID=UPI0009C19437|nr:SDR family NAD(P)-dependent oxidoreductase [Prescottella equi]MBM4733857.1 SDR family NAD(P)-dependent oxidoreductase [Prescottella equi]OQQ25169.1 short-chain dehydrogenase [Prescottella equi]